MNQIKKILSDPIWQGLGVIIAVLTLFLTLTDESAKNGDLEIIRNSSISFDRYLLPSDVLKLNIEKSIQNSDDATVDYYFLVNRGKNPITPEDYFEPIGIKNDSKNRVLLVSSCNKQKTKQLEKQADSCVASSVDVGWFKQNGNWTATPSLINAGEFICIVVIKENNLEPVSWQGRIKGVNIKQYNSMEDFSNAHTHFSDNFYVTVKFEDLEAYWFALLQVAFFYGTLTLSRQARQNTFQADSPMWLIAIMLASTASAEIMVSMYSIGLSNQSVIVWPLLIGHVCLIGYFLIRGLSNRP